MIDLIYFNKSARDYYKLESNQFYISDVSKLNVLSGINNSGKSKFLRSLDTTEKWNLKHYLGDKFNAF